MLRLNLRDILQNPEIQSLYDSVKDLRTEFDKSQKVIEFIRQIASQDDKISAIIQIVNCGFYISKLNIKSISELIQKGEVEQEKIIDFCQIFFEKSEESLKLLFLNNCLWYKIINKFEVFKEIAIDFSTDIFDSLIKSPNMFVARLKLTPKQEQEIIEYRDKKNRVANEEVASVAATFVATSALAEDLALAAQSLRREPEEKRAKPESEASSVVALAEDLALDGDLSAQEEPQTEVYDVFAQRLEDLVKSASGFGPLPSPN